MSSKKIKREIPISLIIPLLWLIYSFLSSKVFFEIKELTTPGSSFMIKLLEFTNYRPKELSVIFIEYFILFSITIFSYIYLLQKFERSKKTITSILLINVVIILICMFISNVFFVVYLLLSVIVSLVILTTFYLSSILFDSKTVFEKGDTIFYSENFASEELANKEFEKKRKSFNTKVSGEVFDIDGEYFFEIYATEKIILDSKEDYTVHEKKK